MPRETLEIAVRVSTTIKFELYFDHVFSDGLGTFDYLHMVRSRTLLFRQDVKQFEEDYWENLNKNRKRFAEGLTDTFDLIVDPPSNSGFHRPYLSAFIQQSEQSGEEIPCVRFLKKTHVHSSPENLAELREKIKAVGEIQGKLGPYKNVLVVDDVFSSGTIMTVVVEKLIEAGLSNKAKLTLACPLRMPLNETH